MGHFSGGISNRLGGLVIVTRIPLARQAAGRVSCYHGLVNPVSV
jgi:hypothetical protein